MSADDYVKFGDFTLVRTLAKRVVVFYPPCSKPLLFKDDDDAWRVDTRIRFHLLVCWDCNS